MSLKSILVGLSLRINAASQMKFFYILFIVIFVSALLTVCKKNDKALPPPAPVDFIVNNRWECDINGVRYSGTVDTSFLQFTGLPGSMDTILFCTGTSDNKEANIQFELYINRTGWGHDSIQLLSGGNRFTFDTSGKNY